MAQRSLPRTLRRQRLSDQLTSQLRKHILDKGLKPGDPLLTEEEMARRFGVSRTVVREATKALDFLGILRAAPRRGTVLDEFSFDRVADYFGFHFALSDYPPEKLLKARMVVESGALYYTMEAVRGDPAVAAGLLRLAEATGAEEDVDRRIERDIAFHRAMVEVTEISPLSAFCDLLHVFFRKFHDRTASGDFTAGGRQHRQIVEALCEGRLDAATETLRRHLAWYQTRREEDRGGSGDG